MCMLSMQKLKKIQRKNKRKRSKLKMYRMQTVKTKTIESKRNAQITFMIHTMWMKLVPLSKFYSIRVTIISSHTNEERQVKTKKKILKYSIFSFSNCYRKIYVFILHFKCVTLTRAIDVVRSSRGSAPFSVCYCCCCCSRCYCCCCCYSCCYCWSTMLSIGMVLDPVMSS